MEFIQNFWWLWALSLVVSTTLFIGSVAIRVNEPINLSLDRSKGMGLVVMSTMGMGASGTLITIVFIMSIAQHFNG